MSEAQVERSVLVREVWIAAVGVLLALGLVKHLVPLVPFVKSYGATIALGLQMYAPLMMRGARGITLESLGLRRDTWALDLKWFFVWSAVVTVPFALGHHVWQTQLMGRPFNFGLPDGVVQRLLTQGLIVAMAEELFFRGYLQERLERLWPAKRKLFGAPFGLAIVVSSAVFALAHFVGEYNPARLGPFFPSLLFGLARARTGSIISAIGLHAYFNVLGELVWASYR